MSTKIIDVIKKNVVVPTLRNITDEIHRLVSSSSHPVFSEEYNSMDLDQRMGVVCKVYRILHCIPVDDDTNIGVIEHYDY